MINGKESSDRLKMENEKRIFATYEEFSSPEGALLKFPRRCTFYEKPGELPPIRAYLHRTDSGEFLEKRVSGHPLDRMINYLKENLSPKLEIVKGGDFLLAVLWGDKENKMIDLFKYSNTEDWPGSPKMKNYVIRNGVYAPEIKKITLRDSLTMLFLEERHRKTTKNLEKYIEQPPSEGF